MAALVQHFGEYNRPGEHELQEYRWDICNPSGESANAAHQPTDEERRWLRLILCMSSLEAAEHIDGQAVLPTCTW